ncbi:MAG: type ii/iv secretion system protein [Verrucomicrobiales bacterium]|nr:type ii/iv secretion system protein [Verrucomicrobiales bacterium]
MYSNEEYLLELLKDAGYLTPDNIVQANSAKRGPQSSLDFLIEHRRVSEDVVAQTLAVNAGMEFVDLSGFVPDPAILDLVPAEVAAKYTVIPVGFDHGRLILAVADPMDFQAMDSLPHVLSTYPLDFYCAQKSQIEQFITDVYGVEKAKEENRVGGSSERSEASEDDAPIVRLVMDMLAEAVSNRASDIHVEPMEKRLRVRYRIDGVLQESASHPKHLHAPMIARLKIMTGQMSIDERRVPQDGRIQARVAGKEIDLRVSTVPTAHGESVVMRILDKSSILLGLSDLGFFSDDLNNFNELLALPDGIILVTGPTGSGKTTTLYACLNNVNRPDRKIITVEDPVEYTLSGINQVPVREDVGMSFASALRSMLRQAPNIIMIGEIRDPETAQIAINAALTGHLVLSTLHTNDAPGAVARMTNLKVKPFLIATAVRAMMAQRLVRKLCAECKTPGELTEKEMRTLGLDSSRLSEAKIMVANGCGKCRTTGYRGRMCIVEIFKVDDQVRHMINQQISTPQLRRRARELGMRTLREDAVRKVLAGLTTAGEAIESTMSDSH